MSTISNFSSKIYFDPNNLFGIAFVIKFLLITLPSLPQLSILWFIQTFSPIINGNINMKESNFATFPTLRILCKYSIACLF